MEITVDCQRLQRDIEGAIARFHQHADINRLLVQLRTLLLVFIEKLVVTHIQQRLNQRDFIAHLKAVAGKSALRFKGYKTTSIRLLTGRNLSIRSPYFAPAHARKGRKPKKRQGKTGCHVGLSYLGFFDRCSMLLASIVVQSALLCPSFVLSRKTLASSGIDLDVKTIRRLSVNMGQQAIEQRCRIAVSDHDQVKGRTLLVCIDGGRLRERTNKKGRRPKSLKRQGYHTHWREPSQLVIQWLDENGTKCRHTKPIYDATMADTDGAFQLLEGYLRQLDVAQADVVIFCADGARKYWRRFTALARRLELKAHLEIIDYTHAKQNLNEIVGKLPKKLDPKTRLAIATEWKNMLFQGDIMELGRQIRRHVAGPKKLKEAIAKFSNYFLANHRRMQYASFKHLVLPCGSGCVESAIRRVINLRLKSAGSFWKRSTSEAMLFLRSTLLCDRWNIMLANLAALNRDGL